MNAPHIIHFRLQETDIEIARKAKEYRIPFVFVRNKADQV